MGNVRPAAVAFRFRTTGSEQIKYISNNIAHNNMEAVKSTPITHKKIPVPQEQETMTATDLQDSPHLHSATIFNRHAYALKPKATFAVL